MTDAGSGELGLDRRAFHILALRAAADLVDKAAQNNEELLYLGRERWHPTDVAKFRNECQIIAEEMRAKAFKMQYGYDETDAPAGAVLRHIDHHGPMSLRAIEQNPPPGMSGKTARVTVQNLTDRGLLRTNEDLKFVRVPFDGEKNRE